MHNYNQQIRYPHYKYANTKVFSEYIEAFDKHPREIETIEPSRDTILELLNDENYIEIAKLIPKRNNFYFEIMPMSGGNYVPKLRDYRDDALEVLINYIANKNDLELLQKLIEINKCKDIFKDLIANYHIIKNIIESKNCEGIAKIILNEMELTQQTADIFMLHIINNRKILLLNIFSEHKHELNLNNITYAILNNKIDIVKYAISHNIDVQNAYDNIDKDSLQIKSTTIGIDMIKLLVDNNINLSLHINKIVLFLVWRDNLDVIKYCVENEYVTDIDAILKEAFKMQKVDIMKYCISAGADVNSVKMEIPIDNLDVIKLLIEYDYHFVDSPGLQYTFAILFTKYEFDEIIFLEKYGAKFGEIFKINPIRHDLDYELKMNANMLDKVECYLSYLEYLVQANKISHIKYLAENYPKEMRNEMDRLVAIASANGHVELFKYFVEFGANPNELALISACYFGRKCIIELLLEKGISAKENLFEIVAHGFYDRERLLNSRQETYYSRSLIKNYPEIFRNDGFVEVQNDISIFTLLFSYNIPAPNINIYAYLPALYYSEELIKYMINNGTNINEIFDGNDFPCDKKVTLLQMMIRWSKLEIIKILLENGADLFANDKIAIREFNIRKVIMSKENEELLKEIRQILIAYGADENELNSEYKLMGPDIDIFEEF